MTTPNQTPVPDGWTKVYANMVRPLTTEESNSILKYIRENPSKDDRVEQLALKFSAEFGTPVTTDCIDFHILRVVMDEVDADLSAGRTGVISCDHIGVAGLTEVHVREINGQFQARVGIALMGMAHDTPITDPFSDEYPNNTADGIGATRDEAIANMRANMKDIAASLHI